MKKYLLSCLAFFIINFIFAQPRFEIGYRYTNIFQNQLKGKTEPYHSFAAAIIVLTHRYTKSKIVPVTGIEFVKTGYRQIIEENIYTNSFTYIYLPVGISYNFVDFMSISAGISGGIRVHGRHITDNTKYRLPKDFHDTDLNFFGGINIIENKDIGFFMKYRQSILPILEYFEIDENGNFIDKIKDIYHTGFQVGLNWKIK